MDAIFAKPFDRKMLMTAVVRAISSKEEKWGGGTFKDAGVDFRIDLKFPELNYSAGGQGLHIGRGGLFVALNENFPVVKARAAFSISFSQGEVDSLDGEGVVRWVRAQAAGADQSGCGIEFEQLSDRCRQPVINLLRRIKMKAFIPKN